MRVTARFGAASIPSFPTRNHAVDSQPSLREFIGPRLLTRHGETRSLH
ncbi:hypothetical protein KCP73_19235 [Salmonella enterica subsp. enterica]|nr:hypothetical protein KCP73_19235 [Salmonella enterica subsp. enterica]